MQAHYKASPKVSKSFKAIRNYARHLAEQNSKIGQPREVCANMCSGLLARVARDMP